jgi:hypothetical protein
MADNAKSKQEFSLWSLRKRQKTELINAEVRDGNPYSPDGFAEAQTAITSVSSLG